MSIIGTILVAAVWYVVGRSSRRPSRGDDLRAKLQEKARWCRDTNRFLGGSQLVPISNCILTVDGCDYHLAITPYAPGLTLIVAKCEQEEPA